MSGVATTSTLCMLYLKLTLQILCESSWFVGVGVVQGCKGVGDIPGILGVQGGSAGSVLQDWIDKNSDLRSKSITGTSYILLCSS